MTKGAGVSEFTKGKSTNRSVVRDEAGEAAPAAMEADAESVGHSVADRQPFSAEVLRASRCVFSNQEAPCMCGHRHRNRLLTWQVCKSREEDPAKIWPSIRLQSGCLRLSIDYISNQSKIYIV